MAGSDVELLRVALEKIPALIEKMGEMNAHMGHHSSRLDSIERLLESHASEGLPRRVRVLEDRLRRVEDVLNILSQLPERMNRVEEDQKDADEHITGLRLQWAKVLGIAAAGGGFAVGLNRVLGLLAGGG